MGDGGGDDDNGDGSTTTVIDNNIPVGVPFLPLENTVICSIYLKPHYYQVVRRT